MKLFHPLFLFVLSLHSSRTSANCYFPNGTDVNLFLAKDVYVPCNAGDDVSMCCALDRSAPDKCRSDGLCLATFDSNLWRESCTDRTWKSPQCIKLCTEGTWSYEPESAPSNLSGVNPTVTRCNDGSYCCGNGTFGQPCCDQRKGVFLLNGDIVSSNTSTATNTATNTATASSATKSSSAASSSSSAAISSSAITSSSPPPSPDQSSSGRTIGIIVSAVLGTALILTMGFAIFLLKKSQRKRRQAVATDQVVASQMVNHAGELYGDDRRKELDGRGHKVELNGRRHEVELGTQQEIYHELRG